MIKLIGILVVAVGFALRFNTLLVVMLRTVSVIAAFMTAAPPATPPAPPTPPPGGLAALLV